MGIRDRTASILLWLAGFLLAFTPHTHQHQTQQRDDVSFDMGAFGVVTGDHPNALQAYPLTDNWGKATVIRVVQGGVEFGSIYDREIKSNKIKAIFNKNPSVKVVNVKPS